MAVIYSWIGFVVFWAVVVCVVLAVAYHAVDFIAPNVRYDRRQHFLILFGWCFTTVFARKVFLARLKHTGGRSLHPSSRANIARSSYEILTKDNLGIEFLGLTVFWIRRYRPLQGARQGARQ